MPIYFVRHGETDWNRQKRFQSTSDIPLNARGIAQAHCIRAELDRRGPRFAVARTSPLGRARETARILLDGTGVEPVVEPGFIELSFGDYEGVLEAELAERYGDVFTAWRAAHYTEPPPGGECLSAGAARVRPALSALLPAARAGDVLIVAHQAVMMAMKVALSGRGTVADAFSFKQENDQLDIWSADGERLEMLRVECPDPA